jgi:hypothetical protein
LEYAQLIQERSINRPRYGWVEEVENGLMKAENEEMEENVVIERNWARHNGDYGS